MNERERLSARIHLAPQEVRRALATYRKRINKPTAVDVRQCGMVYVIGPSGRRFAEAADTVSLMHRYLDKNQVPTHPES